MTTCTAQSPRHSTRPADAWTAELAAVGVPVGTVKTLDQVYDSPQVAAEDLTLDIEYASLGTIRLPGRPLKFGRTARAARAANPWPARRRRPREPVGRASLVTGIRLQADPSGGLSGLVGA